MWYLRDPTIQELRQELFSSYQTESGLDKLDNTLTVYRWDTLTPNQRTNQLTTRERGQPFAHRGSTLCYQTKWQGETFVRCAIYRNKSVWKQIEALGNFCGTRMSTRTSFATLSDGRSQAGEGRQKKERSGEVKIRRVAFVQQFQILEHELHGCGGAAGWLVNALERCLRQRHRAVQGARACPVPQLHCSRWSTASFGLLHAHRSRSHSRKWADAQHDGPMADASGNAVHHWWRLPGAVQTAGGQWLGARSRRLRGAEARHRHAVAPRH